jgi:hypothetical protein
MSNLASIIKGVIKISVESYIDDYFFFFTKKYNIILRYNFFILKKLASGLA